MDMQQHHGIMFDSNLNPLFMNNPVSSPTNTDNNVHSRQPTKDKEQLKSFDAV